MAFQTAYIKFLDIWLFYGLCLPYVAFILEVTEEFLRDKKTGKQLVNEIGL